MEIKIEVPDGKECFGCQSLVPPTYYSREYVCNTFHRPVECYYDFNPKGYYERHIYKCEQCKQAEAKDEHSSN